MISAWVGRVRGTYGRKLQEFWASGQSEEMYAFCTKLAMEGSGAVRVANYVTLGGTSERALRSPNPGFSGQQSVGGYSRVFYEPSHGEKRLYSA